MLSKSIFSIILLVMAILAPSVCAGSSSNRYDPFNQCGAPFCGSTGNAAGAGTLFRMMRKAAVGAVKGPVKETPTNALSRFKKVHLLAYPSFDTTDMA